MARLVGVDLKKDKRIIIALTYIQGIGNTTSKKILDKLKIDKDIRVKELVEQQIVQLRNELQNYVLEGDLRRQVSQNVRRLSEIGSYRGSRHKRKLPSRGQRTHTNARTKRGKRIAVAGKKKVTK
ncbi:30S ribosomal protein S13 [Candidatus Marinamargulisbacteria bacterium SCGC AG-333-B06]|nr:30S ribosomal protein S13 [Candidatus Marinamargulisbacteria bacterium SCGC AG-333-B06]